MCALNALLPSIRWAFNCKDWVPSAKEWEYAARCVQKEERDRVYRFVYAKDAKASMIGQLLMRKASSEATGIPYNEICFSRLQSGKPFIFNYATTVEKLNYNFNISHHGDFCVLAAEGSCVGIDVMKTEYAGSKPLNEYFTLMQKQFSFEEMDFIRSPGLETEQLKRFYRLWCLKESYVKAIGTGISCDLKAISFTCSTPCLLQGITTCDTKLTINGMLSSNWRFEESFLDDSHCVSVAVEQKDLEESSERAKSSGFKFLNFHDLMKNSIPFEEINGEDWTIFSSKQVKPS